MLPTEFLRNITSTFYIWKNKVKIFVFDNIRSRITCFLALYNARNNRKDANYSKQCPLLVNLKIWQYAILALIVSGVFLFGKHVAPHSVSWAHYSNIRVHTHTYTQNYPQDNYLFCGDAICGTQRESQSNSHCTNHAVDMECVTCFLIPINVTNNKLAILCVISIIK